MVEMAQKKKSQSLKILLLLPIGEDKIKEDLAVTSRCMPFNDQEQISDVCVCCGKPAHKLVYWGKAY